MRFMFFGGLTPILAAGYNQYWLFCLRPFHFFIEVDTETNESNKERWRPADFSNSHQNFVTSPRSGYTSRSRMKDLTDPRWIKLKGIMFLLVGILSATL